jgi:hypothetical protein
LLRKEQQKTSQIAKECDEAKIAQAKSEQEIKKLREQLEKANNNRT